MDDNLLCVLGFDLRYILAQPNEYLENDYATVAVDFILNGCKNAVKNVI